MSLQPVPSVPKHRRKIGDTIRAARKAAGWSQEKLAEKSDLSTVFISNVECGKMAISVDKLARIARSLKISLEEMFRGL